MTTNEAAERLLTLLEDCGYAPELMQSDIDEALAAERTATVERIRAALPNAGAPASVTVVLAILDAEAAR